VPRGARLAVGASARRPQGYAVVVDPEAPTRETDTGTCAHCNTVFFYDPLPSGAVEGAFCLHCMKSVCLRCDRIGSCTPFERALERMERGESFARAIGLVDR
jgi:hypothetical protein